jgi:hypothetical protein
LLDTEKGKDHNGLYSFENNEKNANLLSKVIKFNMFPLD